MNKQELSRLKELAEKADAAIQDDQVWAHCDDRLCAEYVAAANPQTVLALIDDLVKTKDALAHCRDKNSQLEKEADWLAEKLVVAQAETVEDIKPPSTMRNAARKAVEVKKHELL